MARIIENDRGRRQVMVSADDVISIVREYQHLLRKHGNYGELYRALKIQGIYLPEEL